MERYTKKEVNNQKQGKSGAKVKRVSGPAVGEASGNATKSGGIFRPTKGKGK
jgi:uncharacterized protein YjcR